MILTTALHTAPKQSGNGWPTNYRPLSDEDVRQGGVDLSTWHQDGQEFTKDGCPVARVQPTPASVLPGVPQEHRQPTLDPLVRLEGKANLAGVNSTYKNWELPMIAIPSREGIALLPTINYQSTSNTPDESAVTADTTLVPK